MKEDNRRINFFSPHVLKGHLPMIGYFAASLFAIMGCEFIATLKAAELLGRDSEYLVYGVYSMSVAFGVFLFYLYRRFTNQRTWDWIMMPIVFGAAILLTVFLLAVQTATLFWTVLVCFFLLAGFNTGMVSVCLYHLYQIKAPVGRILSAASLIGITLHYLVFRLMVGSVLFDIAAPVLLVISIIIMYLLVTRRRLLAATVIIENGEQKPPLPRKRYMRIFIGTLAAIALISFALGISDSVVAGELPAQVKETVFFYPVLFYIPGQVIACLLVDIKNGRYLDITTLIAVIMIIPITLWLKSPEELYLNAGLNYFIGGFFLAYIMTAVISIAEWAKRKLIAVCASGIVYPLFRGFAGFLTSAIITDMGTQMIVFVYTAMIVLMAILAFTRYTAQRTDLIPEPPPLPDLSAFNLTARETEIISLLASGLSTAQIAQTLFISEKTVRAHISNMVTKTGVNSRVELILLARR